mmetsp:Transcript_134837/g.234399  ORF Transcript_134837/g.234399 Transcript_134837/m.234399 type:complete len:85 (-) Transcript_134837:7-261(-)
MHRITAAMQSKQPRQHLWKTDSSDSPMSAVDSSSFFPAAAIHISPSGQEAALFRYQTRDQWRQFNLTGGDNKKDAVTNLGADRP